MAQNNQFIDNAVEAGFTISQAEFLDEHVAKYSHAHSVTEIVGIEEMIDDVVVEMAVDGTDEDIEDEDE